MVPQNAINPNLLPRGQNQVGSMCSDIRIQTFKNVKLPKDTSVENDDNQ